MVEVIAKVPSRYYRVPQYFFHGTYCGTQLVVPPTLQQSSGHLCSYFIRYKDSNSPMNNSVTNQQTVQLAS